jgi:ABC-type branched-subunit amino acid transport system substrate-binding protein
MLEEVSFVGAKKVMINRRQFSQSASALLLAGGAPFARAQGDKIVLGQSAPLSGPAAQLGIQFNAGAKLAFDLVNASGGFGGRQVELRLLDDGYEPDRCVENTHKFIDDDVFGLFGFVGTPTSLQAMPLAVRAKIPFFAPLTGAMALRQPLNRYVFHVRASYNDETALIVKQLTNLGLNKIAVFYQADAYGKAGLDGVKLALGALNLEPVVIATVERNSIEVAQAIATINAAKPEAVIQISAYKSCAAYIRAARKAGYGGLFYNVSFVGTQALATELGALGAGVVVTQVVPSPFAPARPITREFLDAIKRGGSTVQPNFGSMEGFIGARVFIEGLLRSGARPTRDTFINALESMNDFSLGGFKVSFSRTDHVASNHVETSLLTGDGRVRS